jgi:antitoxin component of MazEF toxin-antitoxin module
VRAAIPRSVLSELGLAAGDAMDLRLEDSRVILPKVRRESRAGSCVIAAGAMPL